MAVCLTGSIQGTVKKAAGGATVFPVTAATCLSTEARCCSMVGDTDQCEGSGAAGAGCAAIMVETTALAHVKIIL